MVLWGGIWIFFRASNICNNQGDSAKNIQEEIKAAIEAANQEARQQTELEKQMLDALKNIQIPPQRTIQLAK